MTTNPMQRYYGNERASKVIYGTILISVFLISKDHGAETSSLMIAISTFFAAIAIVVAEIYAELLGTTIRDKKKLTKKERRDVEKDALAIISVSMLPSLIFIVSALGLYSASVAFIISFVVLLIILNVFSYWAARLSGDSTTKSLVTSIIISLIGVAVIWLKYTLGH